MRKTCQADIQGLQRIFRPTITQKIARRQGNFQRSYIVSNTDPSPPLQPIIQPPRAKGKKMTEEWEHRWQKGQTPWDQSQVHPALKDLVLGEKGDEVGLPRVGRAVIPGCGRGYDVDLLASRGLDALGVDISPTGVGEAQSWLAAQPRKEGDGKAEILLADYFEWAKTVQGEFDVILDYTFLCALPGSMRDKWSTTTTLLAKKAPSTRLITLMFPLFEKPNLADRDHPPYPLCKGDYHTLLDEHWVLIHERDLGQEEMRKGDLKGAEAIGVWALRQ